MILYIRYYKLQLKASLHNRSRPVIFTKVLLTSMSWWVVLLAIINEKKNFFLGSNKTKQMLLVEGITFSYRKSALMLRNMENIPYWKSIFYLLFMDYFTMLCHNIRIINVTFVHSPNLPSTKWSWYYFGFIKSMKLQVGLVSLVSSNNFCSCNADTFSLDSVLPKGFIPDGINMLV